MVKSYHLLNGRELEKAPGDSGGQVMPVCAALHAVVKGV